MKDAFSTWKDDFGEEFGEKVFLCDTCMGCVHGMHARTDASVLHILQYIYRIWSTLGTRVVQMYRILWAAGSRHSSIILY